MATKPLLEVCCDSVESALYAAANGADRIELCSRLDLDGLSPSLADTADLFRRLSALPGQTTNPIPVHIMIRYRSGSFVYTPVETEVMKEQTRAFKAQFATSPHLRGFVFGALLDTAPGSYTLDTSAIQSIREVARPYTVTFHRAFDLLASAQFSEALGALADAGVDRVLTSGGIGPATTHIPELQLLMALTTAQKGPTILIGGGVRPHNLQALLEATNATEVHSSQVWRV